MSVGGSTNESGDAKRAIRCGAQSLGHTATAALPRTTHGGGQQGGPEAWCDQNNWKVVFFESAAGAPRTGIVDATMIRIKPRKPDAIEVRLVQLKAGLAGLKAAEISRLKKAVTDLSVDWLLAAYDGETLHLVPDVPRRGKRPI